MHCTVYHRYEITQNLYEVELCNYRLTRFYHIWIVLKQRKTVLWNKFQSFGTNCLSGLKDPPPPPPPPPHHHHHHHHHPPPTHPPTTTTTHTHTTHTPKTKFDYAVGNTILHGIPNKDWFHIFCGLRTSLHWQLSMVNLWLGIMNWKYR